MSSYLVLAALAFAVGCKFEGAPAGVDGTVVDDDGAVGGVDAASGARCALALGSDHTCVHVFADGSLYCFGSDAIGELGNGAATSTHMASKLVLPRVRQVASRFFHSCALLEDRTVSCWGQNDRGQLGIGTADGGAHDPAEVANLGGVESIAAARTFNCARRATDVTCWGDNVVGQLGDGMTENRTTPTTTLSIAAQPIALALGASHGCAMMSGRAAMCWGTNAFGQLGPAAPNPARTPVAAPRSNLVQIIDNGYSTGDANGGQTCGLVDGGDVWCWGSNEFGQLGTGTAGPSMPAPIQAQLSSVVELAMGRYHVCARRQDGSVACWGRNEHGQLGDGSTDPSATPRPVELPGTAVSIEAGGFHTCALLETGQLHCWGRNHAGQLGVPAGSAQATPQRSHALCE